MTYIPGSGSLPNPYSGFLGATSANTEIIVTHGLNTLNVLQPVITRTYSGTGIVPNMNPGDVLSIVSWRKIDANNIAVGFGVAIAANEFVIHVNPFPATMASTGPTAGTIAATPGLSTIDFTISGGTDAVVGNGGVFWYRNSAGTGTPQATTYVDAWQDTGLPSGAATYSYSARRFNLLGTAGLLSNVLTPTTLTPADVAPIGTMVQNRSAGSGVVSAVPTYAVGNLRLAVAVVSVSHSEWFASTSYNVAVNGTQSGGWTRVPEPSSPDVSFGTQYSGSVHIFYKLSPSTAWTTDTVTATFSAGSQSPTFVNAMISIQQYANVDQTTPFGTSVINAPGTNSVPSASVASGAGDYTMAALGYANAAPTGYNKTRIGAIQGADVAGYCDFLLHGHAATASAATITHSTTSSDVHAMIVANLRKAGS